MKSFIGAALTAAVGVGLWAGLSVPVVAGQRCSPDGRGGYICTYVPDNCRNPWQMGCKFDRPVLQPVGGQCFTSCNPGNPRIGLGPQCTTTCY
jgi:hypothetical protein